jgi:hypothetical protein
MLTSTVSYLAFKNAACNSQGQLDHMAFVLKVTYTETTENWTAKNSITWPVYFGEDIRQVMDEIQKYADEDNATVIRAQVLACDHFCNHFVLPVDRGEQYCGD